MKSVTADKSKRAAGGYLPTPRQGRRTLTSASETDSLFNRGRTQSLCKWRRPCESAAGKDRPSPVIFVGGANTMRALPASFSAHGSCPRRLRPRATRDGQARGEE